MEIEITSHARERMYKYNVSESMIKEAIENPTNIMEGYGSRRIYQKRLNGHTLRVIVEVSKEIRKSIIITVYKAKSGRYEI
jgi:hypothetical protein